MAANLTVAAGLIALAALGAVPLTISSSAAALLGKPPTWLRTVRQRSSTDYPKSRRIQPRIVETRKHLERIGLKRIFGHWCDDKGQHWFFDRTIVIHDTHVHRARYERRRASIVVMIDGYPDRFSNFTLDGLRMTLLSSALDPSLKMRQFIRCPEFLSQDTPQSYAAALL